MKNTRGFTLIELMITVAILAILVGIALPAYQNQVQKARRADAVSGLSFPL
ncbi:MAG: prepilin-type N-terminal cleavage/methylation domain-containing protein, partial [Wenzhouxiangellaceae bacterium]|nr:prepilin-type N-terminal cleavage/methylation domain-containing protein [Wenzhouxiangellaceae bacterium]